ncbi:MAG: hypothetical protein K6F53_12490 [Lachnospiraceae bacterium]|nr:hypothetical protein [Lachnospiraceae bacterium]
MNGQNLLQILISTTKSRFASITSKIRLWTSWNFIQARIITKIRSFFTSLFDVRPKHSKDYFTVFGWMISKRLAYSALILIGVVSAWYITSVRHVFSGLSGSGGIRTYKYNSVQLRFASDTVRILGKGGYLAYEGQVSKGYVNGEGTLYDKDSRVVYTGHFAKNRFEEKGTAYYPSGTTMYTGDFHDNLYDGNGKLFREDGSLLYDGGFTRGKRDGEGKLCGANGGVIYNGQFSNDEIVWSSFIGKTAAEAGDMYGGATRIYQDEDMYCVGMTDIGALYAGVTDAGSLDNSVTVETVYVLSDSFPLGESRSQKLSEIGKVMGNPIYEGNSGILLPEAVAVNILNETKPALSGPVEMEKEELFSDVSTVYSYDDTYSVYLTSFQSNGLIYTFVSDMKNDAFVFYSITKAEGEPEE